MQDFMKGRYGVDDLTLSLGVLGMVLALIGSLASLAPLSWIALVVVVLAILRAFSKSIPARERENQMFLDLARKIPVVGPHIGWLDREKGPRPASSASARRPLPRPALPGSIRCRREQARKRWRPAGQRCIQPCEAHRPAHVARAQDHAVLPLQDLRCHSFRSARQGPHPRDLPALRHQGGKGFLTEGSDRLWQFAMTCKDGASVCMHLMNSLGI